MTERVSRELKAFLYDRLYTHHRVNPHDPKGPTAS